MAVGNRAYGKDLSVFTVGSQAVVALVASATIDISTTTVDGTVLVDTAVYNLAYREDYTISFSIAYDGSSTEVANLIDLIGTEVAFSLTMISAGQAYSGTGLLRRGSHNVPDGGQTIDFEIVSAGTALTK